MASLQIADLTGPPSPPPRRSQEVAAALVAVTTFWEFLRGDTGLPRPSAWRQMLLAAPERGPQPPSQPPTSPLPCLGGLWSGSLSLRDVSPGRAQPRGWVEGQRAGVSGGWGKLCPSLLQHPLQRPWGGGRLLSQPPPADPHPPPQMTMLIKPHRRGSENRGYRGREGGSASDRQLALSALTTRKLGE